MNQKLWRGARSSLCKLSLLWPLTLQAGEWKNPGGMWMPEQMPQQSELLRQVGLEIDPQDLSDPASSTLQSVVSLGYCSGSFVSPSGLIVTNHHCVVGMLSHLTQEDAAAGRDQNYVNTGFHAANRASERSAGPEERIYVTMSQEDVTAEVTAGLADISDEAQRGETIVNRIKALVGQAEAATPNTRAEVKSFFRDARFILIKKLELQDVRVVYAPPQAIGTYGGDTDNWSWPRHTGDFSFIRAYVAPDGTSRPFHADNVPYQPQNFLKVAGQGVEAGDLVLVAGYPGSTNRLATAHEVEQSIAKLIPYQLQKIGALRTLLGKLGQSDEALRRKLQSNVQSLDNWLKNRREALQALASVNYLAEKKEFEAQFAAWLAEQNVEGGGPAVLNEMQSVHTRFAAGWQTRMAAGQLSGGVGGGLIHLLDAGIEIVRMAEERPKPDSERHPAYQERNWSRITEGEQAAQLNYDRRISRAVFEWAIAEALSLPEGEAPESLASMFDVSAARRDPAVIKAFLDELYEKTQMEDLSYRLGLLKNATLDDLKASQDPVLRLAIPLAALQKKEEQRSYAASGAQAIVAPRYTKALQRYMESVQQRLLAPDANSTLRITFGHIKGYKRPADGTYQHPFTDVDSMLRKHRWGDPEFEVPAKVLRQIHLRNFGPFTDPNFGTVPVNFLAAVDTTGGNSGSAALNAKGELVGLLFDGNKDALFSDWVFKDDLVRSILLDIRYALWILSRVEGATGLLDEMGVGHS